MKNLKSTRKIFIVLTILLIFNFIGMFLPLPDRIHEGKTLLPVILAPRVALADEYCQDTIQSNIFETEDCTTPAEQPPVINALSAVVMDLDTGRVLFEKNAYKRMPMASTTKIMTAIVAIENGNLDDEVTVSKLASGIWGSVIDLYEGEKIKHQDLLYGLMLSSGNDAAIAIAEHVGGSLENFLEMMNQKARLIGARNTSFKSPHGLDKEGHYSTAYDLAIMTAYALNNPVFSKIVGTKSITIGGNRSFYNTNEMLDMYPGTNGVKTGYTGQAGRCLVTSVNRDGRRLVSVVLNCPSRSVRAISSKKILDYAFNNYTNYTLQEAGEIIASLPVVKGLEDSVKVGTAEKVVLPLRHDELERLEKKVLLHESLEAPVYAGMDVGQIKFMLDEKVLAECVLKTWADVQRKDFRYYIELIIKQWLKLTD
ncbi:MAG TPA: D-alanyl-D-alanine carboxypeptidase family protein [Clostridiales bacterium]|nr:D-alanyl-D-alanine carboxypeptidase family protein [Clostridiales bacterium]